MPEASLRHICRKCLSKWAQDICRKCLSVLWPKSSQKRRFWHLPDICRKCLSKWSETHTPEVSLRFRPTKRKKPTAHICRKCLSKGSETHMPEVSLRFRPTKRKKAYGPRKCLSATCAGSVSLNPVFGDVFFISKKTILATFRRPKWPLEKRPYLGAPEPGAPLCVVQSPRPAP